ncbi:flavodoxin family protein [Patescibacteria group bacterium]|nr:flavodoxin family protein [Patescibacteria group bacterium]
MKAVIIYETLTGTTQYVAEAMQTQLKELGHEVDLHSLRYQGNQPDLSQYELILFGAPTYEDGKLEQAMRVFIARCKEDLSKYKVAVFGLGNSSYPQFCTSAKILEEWVIKQNGKPLVPVLRIDGFPDDMSPIEEWIDSVHQAL